MKGSSKKQQRSNLLPILAVLFAISFFFVDYLYWTAWIVWEAAILTQTMDACYYRNPIVVSLFSALEKRDLGKKIPVEPTPPAIIEAKDYSIKNLEVASQGWTQPVIVRGLFSDSNAVKYWPDKNYLSEKVFKDSKVSVIHNGTIAKHYEMVCAVDPNARESFSEYKSYGETVERIIAGSAETIVFPPASRSKRIREKDVEERWNNVVKEDIDLKRIGPMFLEDVKATVLTQMFLGGGVANDGKQGKALGTGWHGDICNNFVVQVSGIKKWIMVDPKYATYMRPTMRNGKTAVVGAHLSFEEDIMPYIPHHIFDLYPGDMLYNPEWYYHSIHNHPVEPYALGLISRQCHVERNFKMATAFTTAVIVNHFLAGMNDVEARMRIWAMITGGSLMRPNEGVNVADAAEDTTGYTGYKK